MRKVQFIAFVLLLLGAISCSQAETPMAVVVYKSSTCPCCEGWVEHMRLSGFVVTTEVHDDDMDRIKRENGITDTTASCHTAKVGGYVIEGHVPAADVERLLKERPAGVIGLTAPGMPMRSPGMHAEGLPPKGYEVLAIKKDGATEVFSRY